MRGVSAEVLGGAALLVLALSPIVAAPLLVAPGAGEMFANIPNLPPDLAHPLGTQSEGRDILALLARAIPASLFIGLAGGGVSLLLGGMLGMLAGYFGGWVDGLVRTISDVGMTIPTLAILILVGAAFPAISVLGMALIIAATIWMSTTRVIRAQMLTLREREYVRVARMAGAGPAWIVFGELLPNLLPYLAACFVNAVTVAMLSAIGLEMLGLGPGQSQTLGSIVYEALYYTAMWRGLWWWWLPPLLAMVLLFQGLFLLSLALDSIADPRRGMPK